MSSLFWRPQKIQPPWQRSSKEILKQIYLSKLPQAEIQGVLWPSKGHLISQARPTKKSRSDLWWRRASVSFCLSWKCQRKFRKSAKRSPEYCKELCNSARISNSSRAFLDISQHDIHFQHPALKSCNSNIQHPLSAKRMNIDTFFRKNLSTEILKNKKETWGKSCEEFGVSFSAVQE